jgi:hypothetical protein
MQCYYTGRQGTLIRSCIVTYLKALIQSSIVTSVDTGVTSVDTGDCGIHSNSSCIPLDAPPVPWLLLLLP